LVPGLCTKIVSVYGGEGATTTFKVELCSTKMSGSGFILKAWAFAGLAWTGLHALGLDCGLSQKTGLWFM
jgi:hypothetical protein